MLAIKTEITVKYTTILNLSSLGRDLAAPYLLYGEASINNIGRPQERISLIFEKDGYIIDFDWNRIVFAGQGDRDGYKDENGPLRFFFELLEKFSQLDGFGKVEEFKVATWDLVQVADAALLDPYEFKKRYLSEHPYSIDGDLVDLAVNLVYQGQSVQWELVFGPYRQASDIKKHNLIIYPSRKGEFADEKGILARLAASKQEPKPSLATYRMLVDRGSKIISQIG